QKRKRSGDEVRKQASKGNAESAKAGATVADRQVARPKPKSTATEVKKQASKGNAEPAKAGATVADRQEAGPQPKATATNMKKQAGKGNREPAKVTEDGKAAPKSGSGKPPPGERATARCADCGR